MIDIASVNESVVVPREMLGTEEQEAMFVLLARHFEGVSHEQFARDLAGKNRVVLIRRGGVLVGFSTLAVQESEVEGRTVTVVTSGDTIMAPEAWGTTALPRAWISAVGDLRREFPRGRLYWLLITSGFRTYRFLPVFWRNFWPRCDAETPADKARLMRHLAHERFGAEFIGDAGIVRFARPQRLRGPLAEVPSGRTLDRHVAFFLQCNPGHVNGDELVCLAELSDENLTAAGRRMVAAPLSDCGAPA